MLRQIIRILNMMPYNKFLTKVIYKIANYMSDGPVMTRYNYWIEYKKTGIFSTGLRKSVISGSYEKAEFEMLKRLVKTGDTVIDVGANEGYVSLWISKFIGKGGKIFAVEPNPENLVFLHKNIALNPGANIKVIESAVSNQKAKMRFFCSPDSGACGSLTKFSHFKEEEIEVEVDTLDNLLGDLRRVNLIKIDTEGHEFDVLLGARQLISCHKPHICFEVNLTFWAHYNQSVDEMFNYLYNLGYKLFVLNNRHLCPYQWLSDRIINFFAIHASRISELTTGRLISDIKE